MYAYGYRKLFWGIMVITFNINLGFLNVLPDFIGYWMIYSALSLLEAQHEIYKKGKPIALLLIVLTLKDIVRVDNSDFLVEAFGINPIWAMLLGSLVTLLSLYLIYIMCEGVYQLSAERGCEVLRNNTGFRFKAYALLTGIYLLYMPFSLNMAQSTSVLFVILTSISIIIALLFISGLFKQAEKVLAD